MKLGGDKMNKNLKKWLIDKDINDIGKILSETSSMFYYSLDQQRNMRLNAIKKAFKFHYDNNAFYHEYCVKQGVSPIDINKYDDLYNIPLIPVEYFEQGYSKEIMTLPYNYKQLEFHETGILGQHAVAYRDSVTNEYSIIGLSQMFMELFDMRLDVSPIVVYFTPSLLEAPNLGMLRALSILGSMYAASVYAIDGKNLKFKEIFDYIVANKNVAPIYIVAPPFVLDLFMDYMQINHLILKLNASARIITSGGWKKNNGQLIFKESLIDKCMSLLGVDRDQIRDTYGIIETNLFAIECKKQEMHISPYVEVYLRDINNNFHLQSDANGIGLLSILDPSMISYPGFVLTQDVALLKYNCNCERQSAVVQIIGRKPQTTDNNCAITLDRYLSGISSQMKFE